MAKTKRKSDVETGRPHQALRPPEKSLEPANAPGLVVDLEKVMEVVQGHVSGDAAIEAASQKTEGSLPKFDDLVPYDVREKQEEHLWLYEVKRVMEAAENVKMDENGGKVENLGKCLAFSGREHFAEAGTEESYESLSQIADSIVINIHICRYDNEWALMQVGKSEERTTTLLTSERLLDDRFKRSLKAHGQPTAASRKQPVPPDRDFLEKYCDIVNYATEVVAMLAVSTSVHKSWQANILASLAKYSAKLKVLARNPTEYGLRSLRRGEQTIKNMAILKKLDSTKARGDTLAIPGGFGSADFLAGWNFSRSDAEEVRRRKKMSELIGKVTPARKAFHSRMEFMNSWCSSILLQVFEQLIESAASGYPADAFEICSIVHRAGTVESPLPVHIHQDRSGELTGTGYPLLVQQSSYAFELLGRAAEGLAVVKPDDPSVFRVGQAKTREATFEYRSNIKSLDRTKSTKSTKSIRMQALWQVIQIMVPLICTMPRVVREMHNFLRQLSELQPFDLEESLCRGDPAIEAFASLKTPRFEDFNAVPHGLTDFKTLSGSILSQRERQQAAIRDSSSNAWSRLPEDRQRKLAEDAKARRVRLETMGREWVMEEYAVRVKCSLYVSLVLGICAVLVIGGLMVGIFLGERKKGPLQGVDPFNITAYAWVVAAFVMIITKSIRVVEWPWRDFLLGRVTCRSLSELRAVTGADEQDLIIYLLAKESENVLISRGPYNTLFRRRGDQGFSIDVKPEVQTLLAAGLVLVKISTVDGVGLICLDFRTVPIIDDKHIRTEIDHSGNFEEGDLVCRNLPVAETKVKDIELSRIRAQKYHHYATSGWRRVFGIYHRLDQKVR